MSSKASMRATAAAQRRRRRRGRLLLRLVGLLALGALLTAGVLVWQRTRPRAVIPVGERLPELGLVDQRGQPVTRAALAGHVVVVQPIFFHDALHTPALVAPLAALAGLAGDGVRRLSLTLDPAEDTADHLPSVAAALATAAGASASAADAGEGDDGWSVVTGPVERVTTLLDALEVDWRRLQAERARYGAPIFPETRLMLIDAQGRLRDTYDGTSWIERQRLGAEARALATGVRR